MPAIKGLINTRTPAGHAEAMRILQPPQPGGSGNKYGAQKVTNEHGKFDSKHEARRVFDLIDLKERGLIRDLKLDKRDLKFALDVNGTRIGEYTADASFVAIADFEMQTAHGTLFCKTGLRYVCDAKSAATRKIRDYPLRRNLVYALYGIKLVEL